MSFINNVQTAVKEKNKLYHSHHKQSVNHLLSFYTSYTGVVLHHHRKSHTHTAAAI